MNFGDLFASLPKPEIPNVNAKIKNQFSSEEINCESTKVTRRKLVNLLWSHLPPMSCFLSSILPLLESAHGEFFTDTFSRANYLSLVLSKALSVIEQAENKETICDQLWGEGETMPNMDLSGMFDSMKNLMNVGGTDLPNISFSGPQIDLDAELL